MPFCAPVPCLPSSLWSLCRWDSKSPIVCQKNDADDAIRLQYRICVVDDSTGVPVLQVAYATTEEAIEQDWVHATELVSRMLAALQSERKRTPIILKPIPTIPPPPPQSLTSSAVAEGFLKEWSSRDSSVSTAQHSSALLRSFVLLCVLVLGKGC